MNPDSEVIQQCEMAFLLYVVYLCIVILGVESSQAPRYLLHSIDDVTVNVKWCYNAFDQLPKVPEVCKLGH